MFENRVLRGIFGPKRDEKLYNLYSLPNIVRVIKSRRIRWAGHVARMGRREACIWFRWGNLRERDHWEDPVVDGRIILRWIFRKLGCGGMDWIKLAQDRDRCWELVNAVMNLRIPNIRGISLLAAKHLASREGLRSME
jgi:hypothetical protein